MSSTTFEQVNYQNTYKLWDSLELTVTVNQSFQGLPVEALFSMALRVNKKRQFLFVSKLIAKHLAVHPAIALGTGTLLASLLMTKEKLETPPQTAQLSRMIADGNPDSELMKEALAHRVELPKKTVFIGMAETATGLGHSVFQHFENAFYIHTTREHIIGSTPSFVFEEEHSHATSHRVYAPAGMLEDAESIVLIDDEISTGNTLVNLIKALDDQFPGKSYTSLSILDWRNDEQRRHTGHLAEDRNISIDVLSLMSGQFDLHHGSSPEDVQLQELAGTSRLPLNEFVFEEPLRYRSATNQQYVPLTGRFGLSGSNHVEIDRWATEISSTVGKPAEHEKPLIIGIGENMYLPLRFALELSSKALVQTTTRSPIFASDTEEYPIKEKVKFSLPDVDGVDQFLYNVDKLDITTIYLLAESVAVEEKWQPLISYLEKKAPVTWISLTNKKAGELA